MGAALRLNPNIELIRKDNNKKGFTQIESVVVDENIILLQLQGRCSYFWL